MQGTQVKNGLVEFKGHKTCNFESGFKQNSIWLNISDNLELAEYKNHRLSLKKYDCRFLTGTSPDFAVMGWNLKSPDGVLKIARMGRGLLHFENATLKNMLLDMDFGYGQIQILRLRLSLLTI
jgi:hypothetical protein